jgi:D-arabinose 1-dehydrogenase-like Zn-dependent alcohol dehydrogenase
MKAAQIVEFRKPLEIIDLPDPTPGPTDVVLKVEACGICRTDWHLWNGDWDWMGFKAPLPHVPGHEISGVVAEMGSKVKRLTLDSRVTVPWTLACGQCDWCRRGRTNVCQNIAAAGFVYPGAYAEYVRIPNADLNVVPLPDAIEPLAAAGLSCRYMTSYGAVLRQGKVQGGQWVTVFGAGGGMGLAAVQIASAVGAQVIAVDIDAAKLEKAKSEGAVAGVLAAEAALPQAIQEISGGGAHVSIDTVGRSDTIVNSILGLRRGGRHVQAAYTTQPDRGMLAIPVDILGLTEVEIVGCGSGLPHSDFPELITMVERGVLRPASLVTREVGLADLTEVLEAMDAYDTIGVNAVTSF